MRAGYRRRIRRDKRAAQQLWDNLVPRAVEERFLSVYPHLDVLLDGFGKVETDEQLQALWETCIATEAALDSVEQRPDRARQWRVMWVYESFDAVCRAIAETTDPPPRVFRAFDEAVVDFLRVVTRDMPYRDLNRLSVLLVPDPNEAVGTLGLWGFQALVRLEA